MQSPLRYGGRLARLLVSRNREMGRQPSPTPLWLAAWIVIALGATAAAGAQVGVAVENWPLPVWSSRAVDVSRPVTFVAVTPCRIVDTRGAAGPHGGPGLAANSPRDFDLNSGPCTGIPGVSAYSLNFTATQTLGFGDLRVWPEGGTPPLVSTLNYVPNQTVANAAIVPAGFTGAISVVAAVSGTHLIIDINGYFTDTPNLQNRWYFQTQAQVAPAFTGVNLEPLTVLSHGIQGKAVSSGTRSFGVSGVNVNNNANFEVGGVLGESGASFPVPLYGAAGVRGQGVGSVGVLGLSRDSMGVAGGNVDTAGQESSWGGLGCTALIALCGTGNLYLSGGKSFVEPHPTDASKVIKYISLEGNEAGTYFRGRGRFDRGLARIPVPEDFRMVTDAIGLSIQVTPIGEMATYAVVHIDLNEILVKASRNVEFFYTVNGVRKGYEDFSPIAEEAFFLPRSAAYRMPASLSAEAKRKLIANGTYNADGTVNMETAKRLGWTEKWKGSGVTPVKD